MDCFNLRPAQPALLLHRHELHAHAVGNRDRVAGFLPKPSLLVKFPHTDLASILACDQHPLAARVDIEVPGSLDFASDMPHGSQLAIFANLEHGNAVVSAVGDINEMTVWGKDALAVEFPGVALGSVESD